jgi:hypothetical protein
VSMCVAAAAWEPANSAAPAERNLEAEGDKLCLAPGRRVKI